MNKTDLISKQAILDYIDVNEDRDFNLINAPRLIEFINSLPIPDGYDDWMKMVEDKKEQFNGIDRLPSDEDVFGIIEEEIDKWLIKLGYDSSKIEKDDTISKLLIGFMSIMKKELAKKERRIENLMTHISNLTLKNTKAK